MQIHELNNFTGTLGSGAYLAIDDGNDTGKISSQGLLAATEARIDNIIAGPAPSAEEIVDARLGDDGVTYPSLGDAIRDQFSDVKSEINYINNAESLNFIDGGYVRNDGATVDISSVTTDATCRYCVADAVEGDKFTLNGGSAKFARLYAFIDSSGNSLATAVKWLAGNNIIVTAPASSSKIVIGQYLDFQPCYKGVPLDYDIDNLEESVSVAEDKLTEVVETTATASYEQLTSPTQTANKSWSVGSDYVSKTQANNSGWYAVEFPAKPNTQYVIHAQYVGTTQNYSIGFFANDTIQTSMSELKNATQETWQSKSNCTVFTTPDYCNYVRYNCKTASSEVFEILSIDSHSIDENAIPDTIQRSSDNTLLTTNKTVIGAINELYSGGGTSDLPWSLSPSGSDDTTNILAMLNTFGICQLKSGTYNVTNLDMPDDTTLIGVGSSSVLQLSGTDSTAGYAVKMGSRCTVTNLKIVGGTSETTMASSLVNRHGILWEGTYSVDQTAPKTGTIENVWIEHFKGGGITCRDTGTPINNCIKVTNAFINHCRAGINISYSSEFNLFTNVQCYGCYYGVVNNGGNNMFVNCNFSSNTLGFIMASIDSGITLTNVQHGSAVCCHFDHSHANNGIGIKIDGSSNGFMFSGCQLFYSAIDLDNTSGIVFDAMDIGAIGINIDDCAGAILFTNCMFGSAPTVSKSNSPNVIASNCYVRSTGASVTI